MNDTNTDINLHLIINKLFYDKCWIIIGFYIFKLIITVLANAIVIIVVFRDQYMRSVTNYFLVNLSVADLLVALICMPDAAYKAYTTIYPFGDYTCKISAYFQCVAVALSIFTITAMAVDRYLAISRPFGFFYRCFNKKAAIIVILILWIFSFLLFLPIPFVVTTTEIFPNNDQNNSHDYVACVEDFYILSTKYNLKKGFGIAWFVCMFVVPGLIILFTYSMMSRTLCSTIPTLDNSEDASSAQQRNRLMRGRKRVACILLLLIFVFACCWLPYHIVSLIEDMRDDYSRTHDENERIRKIKMYLLFVGHSNSLLNPIIYCVLSRKFRTSIKSMTCAGINCIRRRKPQRDSSGPSSQVQQFGKLQKFPAAQNRSLHLGVNRLQSLRKSTKTCTV